MFSVLKRSITLVESLITRIPLAYKITSWYSIFLMLMIFLFATFIIQYTHSWESNELRGDLQRNVLKVATNPKKFKSFTDGVFLAIYTDEGVVLRGTLPDRFPKESPTSFDSITEITVYDTNFIYYDVRLQNQLNVHGFVRGVIPMNTLVRKSNNMLFALLSGGLVFLLIAAIGGFYLIHRGLKPVRSVTETASQISLKRDLSERIENIPDSRDEIYQLASTFNHMLSSLEESSNREKRFNSDVSHEMRTPIAVIQAESDYGRQYIESIEEAKESFQNIFTQSKGMADMVSQLLEVARLDNMKNIEKHPIPLSQVVAQLSKTYERLSVEKNITFTSHIAEDVVVYGSQILLQQAIANLLDNAFKFEATFVHLSLMVSDVITVTVSDNGIGIPEESIPLIWDRLYQVDTSRTSQANKGLGLGLYFVHNVVQLHDGQVLVESIPSVKTTFGFTLEKSS